MARLARLMQRDDPPGTEGRFDNRRIPAGYTYLLQFAAHDLVHTALPFWQQTEPAPERRNLRSVRLRLQTLYGGGPSACPFAYAAEAEGTGAPSRLRLAPIRGLPDAERQAPLRDIPRAPSPGRSDALLADARNDDNTNVAQLTVLFAAFHNAIVERLVADGVGSPPTRFAFAREATALVYRRVLREDLLPRLLQREVAEAYASPDWRFLEGDAPPGPEMPLEFSHGLFRFGHAMVRDRYRVNDGPPQSLLDVLTTTSSDSPDDMPITPAWVVRWSRFFDFTADGLPSPQPSRRLRPRLATFLRSARVFEPVDEETGQAGLAYRDLMSAGLAGLWSVGALWREIRRRHPPAAGWSELSGDKARAEALRAWLRSESEAAGPGALTGEDLEAIATDPPLCFYVLFEAEHEADGARLGALGSLILAEVLLGALRRDPTRWEDEADGSAPLALSRLAGAVLGAGARPPDGLTDIADMPALVRFARGAEGLGSDRLPFV